MNFNTSLCIMALTLLLMLTVFLSHAEAKGALKLRSNRNKGATCKPNEYLDQEKNICGPCDSNCETCYAASNDSCILCKLPKVKSATTCVQMITIVFKGIDDFTRAKPNKYLRMNAIATLYGIGDPVGRYYYSPRITKDPLASPGSESVSFSWKIVDKWGVINAYNKHETSIAKLKFEVFEIIPDFKQPDVLIGTGYSHQDETPLVSLLPPGLSELKIPINDRNGNKIGVAKRLSFNLMSSFPIQESQSQPVAPQNTPFVGVNGEVTGLGFATRDHGAKTEEDQGLLEFTTIKNDGTIQNMKLLIDLKNIFARQLPKMPKEYIVKLVCDRNHESLVIMRNKTKVIGGICYRLYPSQKFAEIAFLAVTATEQVKGYGTRLMNKYKDKMQKQGIEYLLTYADNYAIGYFKKQGFSKEHRMPPERWKGYIKDYDGGTFMECYIHPKIDYCNISNIIKDQKQYVVEQVKKLSINEQLFEGLNFDDLVNQKKNAMKENTTTTLINIEDIPGVAQSGWTYEDYLELKKTKERSFYLQCANIIELMRKHKSAWPFLEPVNKEDVVDYYEIITDPIDLKTMEKKLQSNCYQDKDTFVNDVRRIFSNARTYNQSETIYYKAANDLEGYINPYLYNLKEDKHGGEEIEEEETVETSNKKTKKKIPGIKKKISKHK